MSSYLLKLSVTCILLELTNSISLYHPSIGIKSHKNPNSTELLHTIQSEQEKEDNTESQPEAGNTVSLEPTELVRPDVIIKRLAPRNEEIPETTQSPEVIISKVERRDVEKASPTNLKNHDEIVEVSQDSDHPPTDDEDFDDSEIQRQKRKTRNRKTGRKTKEGRR